MPECQSLAEEFGALGWSDVAALIAILATVCFFAWLLLR